MAFYPPEGVHDPWTAETWFLWGYPTIEGLTGMPRDGYCCALPTCLDAFYFLRWPLLAGPEAFGREHVDLAVGIEAADDADADDGMGAWATWLDSCPGRLAHPA